MKTVLMLSLFLTSTAFAGYNFHNNPGRMHGLPNKNKDKASSSSLANKHESTERTCTQVGSKDIKVEVIRYIRTGVANLVVTSFKDINAGGRERVGNERTRRGRGAPHYWTTNSYELVITSYYGTSDDKGTLKFLSSGKTVPVTCKR